MKQYLLNIYQPDGVVPPPELLEPVMRKMHALVQEAKDAGVWVFNGGLHQASTATVVRIQKGEAIVTDGPYVEGKEHVGGCLIIKAPDLDAALEWARKISRALVLPGHTDSLPVEVRPFAHKKRTPAADVPELDAEGIDRVFREQYGRAVAVLVRQFGDIDAAEEAVQDAFTTALERWPSAGLPPSPVGWIITTARNRAIDRFRREASRGDRHAHSTLLHATSREPIDEETVRDDRLRLIFTCCHPALAPNGQVALTLRLLGGLTTAEIARAFLVPEVTMAQRLVRAKGKIRDAGHPVPHSRGHRSSRHGFAPCSRSSI